MIKIHPNTHTTSQRLVAWTSFLNFSMNSIAVCVPSSWGLAQIEGTYGAKKLVKERSLPLYATFGLYYVIFQHQDCILEHICYRNFVYFLTTIPALPHARRVSSPSAWPLRASCSFPGFRILHTWGISQRFSEIAMGIQPNRFTPKVCPTKFL